MERGVWVLKDRADFRNIASVLFKPLLSPSLLEWSSCLFPCPFRNLVLTNQFWSLHGLAHTVFISVPVLRYYFRWWAEAMQTPFPHRLRSRPQNFCLV